MPNTNSRYQFRQLGGLIMLGVFAASAVACSADGSSHTLTTVKFVDPNGQFEQAIDYDSVALETAEKSLFSMIGPEVDALLDATSEQARQTALHSAFEKLQAQDGATLVQAVKDADIFFDRTQYRQVARLKTNTILEKMNPEHTEKSKYFARIRISQEPGDIKESWEGKRVFIFVSIYNGRPILKDQERDLHNTERPRGAQKLVEYSYFAHTTYPRTPDGELQVPLEPKFSCRVRIEDDLPDHLYVPGITPLDYLDKTAEADVQWSGLQLGGYQNEHLTITGSMNPQDCNVTRAFEIVANVLGQDTEVFERSKVGHALRFPFRRGVAKVLLATLIVASLAVAITALATPGALAVGLADSALNAYFARVILKDYDRWDNGKTFREEWADWRRAKQVTRIIERTPDGS